MLKHHPKEVPHIPLLWRYFRAYSKLEAKNKKCAKWPLKGCLLVSRRSTSLQ